MWGSVSWQWLQRLPCLQAMWLKRSGWQCIQSRRKKRKKSHCSNGDKREPGYLDIVYSQRAAHIKRLLWIFVPWNISGVSGQIFFISQTLEAQLFWLFFFFFFKPLLKTQVNVAPAPVFLQLCWYRMLKTLGPGWEPMRRSTLNTDCFLFFFFALKTQTCGAALSVIPSTSSQSRSPTSRAAAELVDKTLIRRTRCCLCGRYERRRKKLLLTTAVHRSVIAPPHFHSLLNNRYSFLILNF